MAQALFEDHPLKEYLREMGEVTTMPGGNSELGSVLGEDIDDNAGEEDENELDWMPPVMLEAFTLIREMLSSLRTAPQSRFEEQFKYDVISSNLLSSSLPAPSCARRNAQDTLHVPGHLRSSRETSEDEGAIDITDAPTPSAPAPNSDSVAVAALNSAYLPPSLVAAAAVLALVDAYGIAVLLLSAALYFAYERGQMAFKSRQDPSSIALDMLHELIHAGNAWDTAVNEVFSIVELDEKRYENSTYCSPASPSSPTSPLRISLQTTLHTTTNQCDNIRQLLSAVTCPTSLSQLSEMYAPPSPSASPLRQTFTGSSSGRPTSFPDRTLRSDIEEEKENKRATWNGSYTSLAFSGKDRRKEKRRSDLSAILQPPASAPATPSLGNVVEEDGQEGNAEVEADGEAELGDEYFGKDALGLRRRRRAGGINSMIAMSTPPPSAPPSPLSPRYQAQLQPEPRRRTTSLTKRRSMASLSTSLPAGSRYTLMPAARHPLSLTSIHTSLQNALAAKRYACAHLLALRFQDEDEAYWEDVKSVVSLLKSTFEDASERLGEALQQTYDRRARDGSMTPLSTHSRVVSLEDTPRKSRAQAEKERTAMVMEDLLAVPSFAPMPSQLTRFATHAETISTALGDARVHLEECMVSLRAVEPQVQSEEETEVPGQLPPALEAYERLRRELGLALRECERGRERLLDLLTPRRPARAEESDEADDLPALGPDVGSDESDKHDSMTPLVPPGSAELVAVVDPETLGREDALDDVTSHLLLGTSSQHLPPPGIEQVYESDSVDRAAFTREKSKLSREERIRLMKERREKAGSLYLRPSSVDEAQESPTADQWGPGGDVVQELKDVIWQVGEKRRKIGEGHRSLPSLPEATSTPGLDDKESRTLS